jgi:choline monooxygenase
MRALPHIDPDIHKAKTLPGWFYGHPEWHERVLESVFLPSWQLLPTHVEAPERGVVPFEVLGRPLILSSEGRCFSNVCTHRGAVIAEAACTTLRCPYHGRRFGLDGRMQGAPGFEDARDEDHLPELTLRRFGPLTFASPEGDSPCPAEALDLPEAAWEKGPQQHFDIHCSWALYVENYLEGLHIPFVHPGLNEALSWGRYRNHVGDLSTRQEGVDGRGAVIARYWWLWPNTMVNLYPWGLSLNQVQPLGPDRCRVHYFTLVSDPSQLNQGAGADVGAVELEDQTVVTSVQRGVRSPLYTRGRFSPSYEQGLHHFQRLLVDALT